MHCAIRSASSFNPAFPVLLYSPMSIHSKVQINWFCNHLSALHCPCSASSAKPCPSSFANANGKSPFQLVWQSTRSNCMHCPCAAGPANPALLYSPMPMSRVKPVHQKLLCQGDHGTVYIMQSAGSLYRTISVTLTHPLTDKTCPL